MDAGLVLDSDGALWVREGRRLKRGDMVAVGEKEDGSEGIFVQTHLVPTGADPDAFTSMSSEVSREKPIDYANMARVLIEERRAAAIRSGSTGPALVHSRARDDIAWFIANGYVGALLAGKPLRCTTSKRRSTAPRSACRTRGDHAGRSRTAHARDQPRALCRFDRQRSAKRNHHERHHVLVREENVPFVLTGSIRETVRCPSHHRCLRRRTRCARTRSRRRWRSSSPRASCDRTATCCRRSSRGPTDDARAVDDLRGLVGIRREQAEGSRNAPGVRRRHQRTGLHAHPSALRGARARGQRQHRRRPPNRRRDDDSHGDARTLSRRDRGAGARPKESPRFIFFSRSSRAASRAAWPWSSDAAAETRRMVVYTASYRLR